MQAGAVLLSAIIKQSSVYDLADGVPVATRMNNVQFRAMVHPGEEITVEVELIEQLAKAFFMKAKVTNVTTGKLAVRLEFACTLTTNTRK